MTLPSAKDKKTNEEKQNLIAALKKKISSYSTDPYWTSDEFLYKWIQDKNYAVDRAEKAYRKTLKWRLENNIDDILNENFDEYEKNVVYFRDGKDNEGRAVLCLPCNSCSISANIMGGEKEKLLRAFRHSIERIGSELRKVCYETPNEPNELVVIIDLDGVDVSKVGTEVVTFCVNIALGMEDYYPGIIHHIYAINASKAMKKIFKFAQSFFRRNTVERLSVLGQKRVKWEPLVLKNISPSELRKRFGGTREDEEDENSKNTTEIEMDLENLKIESGEKTTQISN